MLTAKIVKLYAELCCTDLYIQGTKHWWQSIIFSKSQQRELEIINPPLPLQPLKWLRMKNKDENIQLHEYMNQQSVFTVQPAFYIQSHQRRNKRSTHDQFFWWTATWCMSISFNITERPHESQGAVLDPQTLSCCVSPLKRSLTSAAEVPAWTMSPQNRHVTSLKGHSTDWCWTCYQKLLDEQANKNSVINFKKGNITLPSFLFQGLFHKGNSMGREILSCASQFPLSEMLAHILHNGHGSRPHPSLEQPHNRYADRWYCASCSKLHVVLYSWKVCNVYSFGILLYLHQQTMWKIRLAVQSLN